MRKYLIFIVLFLGLISCRENDGKKSASDDSEVFNEKDYYIVQGIVVREDIGFSYTEKFKKDIYYIYKLELAKPLCGVEVNSEYVTHAEEPVAVMVHKKDSTKSFIAYRGIIDEEILVDYLTNPDTDYEKWVTY